MGNTLQGQESMQSWRKTKFLQEPRGYFVFLEELGVNILRDPQEFCKNLENLTETCLPPKNFHYSKRIYFDPEKRFEDMSDSEAKSVSKT